MLGCAMVGIKKLRRKSVERFWWRYRRNRISVVGLIIILIFIFLAFLAPFLAPVDPFKMIAQRFLPPGYEHPMGTDDLGRDILSRFLYGVRISLFIGFLSAATSTIIGTAIGTISGYWGGKIDGLLMRITEFFMVIPKFFLALILVAVFGPSLWNIILVIGILSWPSTARIARAQFLSIKEREFVEAARAVGVGEGSIALFEILPNASPPIIVAASLQVASAILTESALSFLGLGDPTKISWGLMLYYARPFLRNAWWMMIFPGLGISLTTLGINLVGEGLNEALNPRLKER